MFFSGEVIRKVLEFIYTGATLTNPSDEPDLLEILAIFEVGGCNEVKICDSSPSSEFLSEELCSSERNSIEDPTANNEKSFTCKICGQVLKTRTGLRMHLLTHEGTRGKAFTCDVCGKGDENNFS